MQKVNFIALAAAAVLYYAPQAAQAQQFRAFWADAYHYGYKNPAEIEQMVNDVAAARGNVIVVEVRRSGHSYYLKSVEPPMLEATYSPNFDALAYLIDRAHARGIEVHAWFPVTPLWPGSTPPSDPRHAWHQHGPKVADGEMWMTVSNAGKVSTSVDPGHPGAAAYLADLMVNVARDYDVDGIHLDYIRYPEDADYGWNPTAVARFNLANNQTGTPAARESSWSAFRRKQVTDLVRQVYLRTLAVKPRAIVSAAVITWGNGPTSDAGFLSTDAYSRVFQDWRGWLEEGILDVAIPMNYFRETVYASYLDRWLTFEKDRQYRRATAVGLGTYLNSIPESVAQLERVLKPSAAGNKALGVSFYSYASTNILNSQGLPTIPNAEFYTATAAAFGESAAPPALPWKSKPDRGHAYGWLSIDGGADWMRDGATVWLVPESALTVRYRATTDGTGFFGVVDLAPGAYHATLERGGVELVRTAAQDLAAGSMIRFDFHLKPGDFDAVAPALQAGGTPAAPGEIVTLNGRNLAGDFAVATSVPLPATLAGTQVLVNGQPAPLFWAAGDGIMLQLPYMNAPSWDIVVRRAGMESAHVNLAALGSHPRITGVRVDPRGYAEIYATGLGMVDPPVLAGAGGPSAEPFPRVVNPPAVFVDNARVTPLYMGLAPGQPGRYQVNVALPEGTGTAFEVRIEGGETYRLAGTPLR